MNLGEFLERSGTTMTAFAAGLGVGVSTVHGWVSGRRLPGLEMAARIREATDGSVTFDDFLVARDAAGRSGEAA